MLARLGTGPMWCCLLLIVSAVVLTAQAQDTVEQRCGPGGVQARPASFEPGGIILTSFDGASLWVYDIDRATRYPLPETRPCLGNCHLSPDARWLIYPDPRTASFSRMRLDGTQQRSVLVAGAADVLWWSPDMLLVWTPDHRAYLRPLEDPTGPRDDLPAEGVISVQPGGRYGLLLEQRAQGFQWVLANLEGLADPDVAAQPVSLVPDRPYLTAAVWSPQGRALAYLGRGALDPDTGIQGAEIFLIRPGDAIPRQLTYFTGSYGAVRIGGQGPGGLSWSPDGTRLAFWLMELLGPDPETDAGQAVIHILDVETGAVTAYCAFATDEHTPNPPRLVWSPDGSHLAFGGNIPGDDRGYLLLVLDTADGRLLEFSDGIYPVGGSPDVVAWGRAP